MSLKNINREIKSKQFQFLAESFKIWMETLGYKTETTKLNYSNTLEFFAFLESIKINQLRSYKKQHVNDYLEYLQHRPNCNKTGGLSPSYINKHISGLRLLSKYLQQSGKANIVIKLELLKTTETASFLTKTQIQALYKSANDENNIYNQRDTAMLSVLYGCGLRAGEAESVNVNDVLFEKGLLYVRKGKGYKERYVPLSKQVKHDLQYYILNQRNEIVNNKKVEALLLGRHGTSWSVNGMYHRLQLLKKQTNNEELKQKSFGLHILRHSIATHLLQDGMKLELISRFLGHKSLETTQKYTHLINESEF